VHDNQSTNNHFLDVEKFRHNGIKKLGGFVLTDAIEV